MKNEFIITVDEKNRFESLFLVHQIDGRLDGSKALTLSDNSSAHLMNGHFPHTSKQGSENDRMVNYITDSGKYYFWYCDQSFNFYIILKESFSIESFNSLIDISELKDASYIGVHSIQNKASFFFDTWVEYSVLYNENNLINSLFSPIKKEDFLFGFGSINNSFMRHAKFVANYYKFYI